MEFEVPVEKYVQKRKWSCGPAALKILLDFNGHEVSEDQLVVLTGSNPDGGTEHEGLISAAKRLGYTVIAMNNTPDDLIKKLISQYIPVLVDFQGNQGGHYAVVTGFDDTGRVHLQDPRKEGANQRTLDWNIFKARWYNITYTDKRFVNRWMMAVLPR